MGILRLKYKITEINDGYNFSLPQAKFEKFNTSILGLGDVSREGEVINSLAAVFDLESFTSFCNQIDPHLVIPEYLNTFLDWLFQSISTELTQKKAKSEVVLWCQLPFYAKFLGDGVLFLWDTTELEPVNLGNIVISLLGICESYRDSFLPEIRKSVSRAPSRLRCGIARGQIISVGEGQDFVGPCINVAARLQKMGQFSFAFSKRGFDLKTSFVSEAHDKFKLIKSAIRGVGEEELMFVLDKEFKALPMKLRKQLAP